MNMKYFALILMSLLMVCCTKNSEVKAATVQEAGKTLVVYYSYTNNCHEIVTSLTSQVQADVMRAIPKHHYRHATVVEPDGGHHADIPI